MSYAVKNDGSGWRAVNEPSDVVAGETYYDTLPTPTSAQILASAQTLQNAVLEMAYQDAIAQPVNYTSKGGITKSFQADAKAVDNLQRSINGCLANQATPSGFFWVSADNSQVPFTYADLTGLAAVIFAQGAAAFAHLQTQKSAVRAATTVAAVESIGW